MAVWYRYQSNDRMCDLIEANYSMLLVLSRFGISLGFGEKSIGSVCRSSGVDVETFLTVVNLLFGEPIETDSLDAELSLRTLVTYLHTSHDYFLKFRLPAIRRKLIEAIDCGSDDISFILIRFFDEYVAEVRKHMDYEETKVFPYVTSLLQQTPDSQYNISIFRKQHDQVEMKLTELKNIIIRYYPASGSNALNSVLFDIFSCEQDLASHNRIEDDLFVPLVLRREKQIYSES